ncbi:hypothetical protein P5G62_029745 [Neobacillus sp. 179-C4.2 HS]|uniref:Uncharacterized protein n=1 Tax=Neobacillus driksii TaxID=3035913 RepID=A0ABV4Z4S2_9BACI|nr:hypothetical protein [Neobacillus sp. 179.-C4.2 HS]MDP5196848.1 hypothetical protein [Neobacillus sp. 179.-C4.2 HS]
MISLSKPSPQQVTTITLMMAAASRSSNHAIRFLKFPLRLSIFFEQRRLGFWRRKCGGTGEGGGGSGAF